MHDFEHFTIHVNTIESYDLLRTSFYVHNSEHS